jgi:hypothetical protein
MTSGWAFILIVLNPQILFSPQQTQNGISDTFNNKSDKPKTIIELQQ